MPDIELRGSISLYSVTVAFVKRYF